MIDVSKYTKVAEYKEGNLHWFEGRDINAVYLIMIGDESYIGSSKYLYTRIQEHISQLRRNSHTDKIQKAFNSTNSFDVYSIERGVDERFLLGKEMQYIRSLSPSLNINGNQKDSGTSSGIKEQIEKVIKDKGLTNATVAKMLNRPTDSSNFGRMIINPSWPTLERIANALGISVVELIDDRKQTQSTRTAHSVIIDGIEYVPKEKDA